jgi:hypothetical protein
VLGKSSVHYATKPSSNGTPAGNRT